MRSLPDSRTVSSKSKVSVGDGLGDGLSDGEGLGSVVSDGDGDGLGDGEPGGCPPPGPPGGMGCTSGVASTRRIRIDHSSANNVLPPPSTTTPEGFHNRALVAGPPSPQGAFAT